LSRLTLGAKSDRLTDDLLRDSFEVGSIELDSRVGTVVAFSPLMSFFGLFLPAKAWV
jgi:hypothetical protein